MEDLTLIQGEISIVLYQDFIFYIPFEYIETNGVDRLFHTLNIDLNEEFIDKYVDRLVFMNKDFDIDLVTETNLLELGNNANKLLNLKNNSFKLLKLKDELPLESFNFIFNKYLEELQGYTFLAKMFYDNYDIIFPDDSNLKKIFYQQHLFFETHLNDIEKLIGIKSKPTSIDEIVNSLENFGIIEQIQKKATKPKEVLYLGEYIIHKNKNKIAEQIKIEFQNSYGIEFRYLIEFLIEEKLISMIHGKKMSIYKSLILLFNNKNIGEYNTIFDSKIYPEKDLKYLSFKSTISKELKSLIN